MLTPAHAPAMTADAVRIAHVVPRIGDDDIANRTLQIHLTRTRATA
jgi:hypothetical protein